MIDFFSKLFDTADFPARWNCGLWTDGHGWLHIVSDVAIFLAYAAIPFVIGVFVARRKDLAFPKVYWLFCLFIFSCGLVHCVEAVIFWAPIYRAAGVLKFLTAVASWATVIALLRTIPQALDLPSQAKLASDLREENVRRKRVEEELRRSQSEYELILDAIPSLLILKDTKNGIRRVNRPMAEKIGKDRAEVEGRNSAEIFPDMAETYYQDDLVVLESGEPRLQIVEKVEDHWVSTDKIPVRDESGEIDGIIVVMTDVTSQVQAQEMVQAAFEASPTGLMTVDAKSQIVMANSAVARIFGYDTESLIGRTVEDLVPHSRRRQHAVEVADYLSDQTKRSMNSGRKLYGLRADESEFPVEITLTPIETTDGRHTLASVVDLTERLSKQAELERVTELFEHASRQARIGGWSLDLRTSELEWTRETYRIHEVEDGFVPTVETAIDFYAEQARPLIAKAIDDAVLEQKPWDLQLELVTAKQRRIWARALGEPRVQNGEVVALVGSFQDVSERVAAQRAIQISEERLETALTNANVGLWDWYAESGETFYSETTRTQLGYSPDVKWDSFDVWLDLLHPDDRERAVETFERYVQRKTDDYTSTFRLRCADDTYRWIYSAGRGTFNVDGDVERVTGVHVDVTDRVESQLSLEKASRDLVRANDSLQRSNDELQQFAYIASHDLQTPLRGISGFAEFLRDDYEDVLDQTGVEYIERIMGGCRRMRQLIDDLLAFARVESKMTPVTAVDLNGVLEETVEILRPEIEAADGTVVFDQLPTCHVDTTQMLQLFQNLIGNGIKYRGDAKPRVHVSAKRVGNNWQFSIEDNGIGIPENQREKVFAAFYRLHGEDAYSGTGIGLAICRKIIQRHGGEIWIDSNSSGGSTFVFTLPATSE